MHGLESFGAEKLREATKVERGQWSEEMKLHGELVQKLTAIHAKRCAGCHQRGEVTRLDWINLRKPQESLFLAAPLAKAAAGKQKCSRAVYQDQSDPDYRAVLQLVQSAVRKAWDLPRRDVKSLEQKPTVVTR